MATTRAPSQGTGLARAAAKRNERSRNPRGGYTLRTALLALAVLSAGGTGVAMLLAGYAHGYAYTGPAAERRLEAELDRFATGLLSATRPATDLLAEARDALSTGAWPLEEPHALTRRLVPRLAAYPALYGVELVLSDGTAYTLTPAEDGWETRWHWMEEGAPRALLGQWDEAGRVLRAERRTEPGSDPRAAAWCAAALDAWRARSDGNRGGTPAAIWRGPDAPAPDAVQRYTLALAVSVPGGGTAAVRIVLPRYRLAEAAANTNALSGTTLLAMNADDTILGLSPPRGLDVRRRTGPSPELDAGRLPVLARLVHIWRTDDTIGSALFDAPGRGARVFARARPLPLPAEPAPLLVASVPEPVLLRPWRQQAERISLVLAGGVLVAVALALLVAEPLHRPLRALHTRLTQRHRPAGYWPRTRWREARALFEALDRLSEAPPAPAPGVPPEAPAATAEPTAPSAPAPPVHAAPPTAMPEPPAAFMQALFTSRRDLRRLRETAETLDLERAAHAVDLQRERAAAGALRDAVVELAGDTAERRAAWLEGRLTRLLAAQRVRVWEVEESMPPALAVDTADDPPLGILPAAVLHTLAAEGPVMLVQVGDAPWGPLLLEQAGLSPEAHTVLLARWRRPEGGARVLLAEYEVGLPPAEAHAAAALLVLSWTGGEPAAEPPE